MEGRLSKVQIMLSEEEVKKIEEVFGEYLTESEAKDIVLLNKSGELLAKTGDITADVAQNISALAAGVFRLRMSLQDYSAKKNLRLLSIRVRKPTFIFLSSLKMHFLQ